MMRVPGQKVLGTCYVCGKPARGMRASIAHSRAVAKGGVLRDVNGIRHGGCDPYRRGRASPSDA